MESNKEVEVRFIKIDIDDVRKKLTDLGFEDLGEDMFLEIVFYDKDLEWREQRKIVTQYVRIRKTKDGVKVTYKHHRQDIPTAEAKEIEFTVSSVEQMQAFLESLGLVAYRMQEKKRHTYKKGSMVVDIDTWPQVPTYIEIEGETEEMIRTVVQELGLDWKDVIWENAGNLIEKYYQLDVSRMKYYMFDKIEYYPEQ